MSAFSGTATRCHCGTGMSTTTGGARYCENCDTAQPHERFGYERRTTREDIRYNMYWLKQMEGYKDNTVPVETNEEDDDYGKPADSD